MLPPMNDGHTVEQWLESQIGSNAWGKFQENTRTDIVTAVSCYQSFSSTNKLVDYAASIVPLMKALEHELRNRFYDAYVAFLKENYSPEEYADSILPDLFSEDYKKATQLKDSVLEYNNGRLKFVDTGTVEFFPLGTFVRLVKKCDPKGNRNNLQIDPPVFEYCKTVLFPGISVSNTKIKIWLSDIILGVEAQRGLRNNSAHGGIVQNKLDAEKAIRDIVIVEKLLGMIICPTFLKL